MTNREGGSSSVAEFREQVETLKGIVETEIIHEFLRIKVELSKSISRFSNVLLVTAGVVAAAGLTQFDRIVELIGYGGAIAAFAILALSAIIGFLSKDLGQRSEMMIAGLIPVSGLAAKVAGHHSERLRALEKLGDRAGSPFKPGDADPDLIAVESALTYPDNFLTRWAFGVVPSDPEGSAYSQIMTNIANQAIAQKLQLAALILLFVVVAGALPYRHAQLLVDRDPTVEACFGAHVLYPAAVREFGHAGILSYCLKSRESLAKWKCVSQKVPARVALAAAKKECKVVDEPKREK